MAPALRVYRDALFYLHDDPYGRHIESPKRLEAAYRGLARYGVLAAAEERPSPRLDGIETLLESVHDPSYIRLVEKLSRRGGGYLDADTYVNPYTYDAGLAVAASTLEAALEAARGGAPSLVLGRPPGHHAGRYGAAMGAPTLGFCIFNATALAATVLADMGYRVLVLDFDLHHGNGTQEILYSDPRVVHVDLHQDPSTIYPGTGWPWETGEGDAEGTKLNLVLPPGSGDDVFTYMAEAGLELAVELNWSPDIVLVDAGFDAYQGDGLGWLNLSTASYAKLARLVRKLSSRIVIVLEGGYSLGLELGLPAFIANLLGIGSYKAEEPTTSSGETWREAGGNLKALCKNLGATGC